MRALLVGVACFLGTETVASNRPPVFVSPIWPTNAILLCVLVVTPVRHWWAYALAGFFSSVNHNAHTGDRVPQILTFLVADVYEVVSTALGVRLFADGLGAFESPRNLVAYLIVVFVTPFLSAFVAATAASPGADWILWRSWFLANTTGYLTLAPAILTWISVRRPDLWTAPRARQIEAGLLGAGLLLTTARVFSLGGIEAHSPALLYLPLPFLLWAAMRFGPRGATASLATVTLLAMSGALSGHGPFISGTPADNALSLQVFLITISPPLMFLAVLVEEQQRSQRTLRRSAAQYRAVVEDQTELICRFRPDGTYTFVNGAVCRMFDRSAEEIVGHKFWEFLPADDHEPTREYLNSITPDRPLATREHQMAARPDRDVLWTHWTTRGFFDDHGAVTEYQAVGRDITAGKRAEEERRQLESQRQIERVLRASEERFRSLADNAPVLIWMSSPQRGEGVYFNKPWLDFTGRSLDQALGFGWIDSIHPDDRQECIDGCTEAFARREPWTRQLRLRRHDGEYRWILDNAVPYFGVDGSFSGYVGSCVDITRRKLAEEELEHASRRKDEFLAMLGHELRNPLSAVRSALAIAGLDDSRRPRALEIARRQTDQLGRLVDDLLDVARITQGRISLRKEQVYLSETIQRAVESTRPVIERRGLRLTVALAPDPIRVEGDAVRLEQVFVNLLSNAAKYTDSGGRIDVTTERLGDEVAIRVRDTGIGIAPEMLPRVWDLFAQADRGLDRAQGGLGIGLTVTRRLVELHGGRIEASSEGLGKGAEFVVTLTALPVLTDEPRPSAPAQPPPQRSARVLLVEDNPDMAESLTTLLELLGHRVRSVSDGVTALDAARANAPDVMLVDIGLPGMDGYEIARLVRQDPDLKEVLLVAVTGYGRGEDKQRALEAGFDYHLVKPLDPDELNEVVARPPDWV
jgi:PAS domain S-box-containing protein